MALMKPPDGMLWDVAREKWVTPQEARIGREKLYGKIRENVPSSNQNAAFEASFPHFCTQEIVPSS